MRDLTIPTLFSLIPLTLALPSASPSALPTNINLNTNRNISNPIFSSLEQLSRIVDISYCVGTTGISHPFSCASRCDEFPNFELVDTFNTGRLMSDSCGYVVLDHGDGKGEEGRIIVAFRGTYSIANTIVDLSTVPQEYVPYPGDGEGEGNGTPVSEIQGDENEGEMERKEKIRWKQPWRWGVGGKKNTVVEGNVKKEHIKCTNCTVHSGFWTSWQNTRTLIIPHIQTARENYPNYKLHLVGHSLGGAVAALAGLEFNALGWEPVVTTFGEPRIGNSGLREFVDASFDLPGDNTTSHGIGVEGGRYRRITHVDDPVPLLPLHEWGYRSHAGEIYISKGPLQPAVGDLMGCGGDEDGDCIAGAEVDEMWFNGYFDGLLTGSEEEVQKALAGEDGESDVDGEVLGKRWNIPIPARYKMWQLFFAHRDYFWRLGLCAPGGDPSDWGRDKYRFGEGTGEDETGKVELK